MNFGLNSSFKTTLVSYTGCPKKASHFVIKKAVELFNKKLCLDVFGMLKHIVI